MAREKLREKQGGPEAVGLPCQAGGINEKWRRSETGFPAEKHALAEA